MLTNVRFVLTSQALLPIELVFQAPNYFKSSDIVNLATKLDLFTQVESAASQITVFRTSTYEKQIRNMLHDYNLRNDNASVILIGNLYEFRRQCLQLPLSTTIVPSLPALWDVLAEFNISFRKWI